MEAQPVVDLKLPGQYHHIKPTTGPGAAFGRSPEILEEELYRIISLLCIFVSEIYLLN